MGVSGHLAPAPPDNSPGPPPVLRATDVEVRFGRGPQAAVTGVSLELSRGEGLLVHGPAGSGKSSLLRGLLGLAPHTGEVRLFGRPPFEPAALRRVGYAPAGRPVCSGQRVAELVTIVARARGLDRPAERAHEALDALGLDRHERDVNRLDSEELRRVTLALAVLGEPELLVLDDPWEMPETVATIRSARARGACVLIAAREPGLLSEHVDDRTLALGEGRPA